MKTKIPFSRRCLLLCALVLAASSAIAWKLVALQIVDSENHSRIAAEELIDQETLPAQRGIIMDRNEEMLTNNIQNAELIADRFHLREVTVVVDGLAHHMASQDERWKDCTDDKSRRGLVREYRGKLLENALRRTTAAPKDIRQMATDKKDAKSNRLRNYDPEVCRYYFELHDRLVATILHNFLSDQQVEIESEPQTAKNGKKTATAEKKYRPLTVEDIIRKIDQPDVAEHNAQAEKNGGEMRKYSNRIVLATNLSFDKADRIREALKAARVRGIKIESSLRRNYVMPGLLCHVLGYVNHENVGMFGIEQAYNGFLTGTNGIREYRHNARGQVLPHEDDRFMAPKHGLNLKLTIDMRIQAVVEQELDAGMRHFRASRGCMVVVDPKTGDILALVNRPAFNLNTKETITHNGVMPRGSVRNSQGKIETGDYNFAIQALYEPGSTFKVVAVTAAVNEKLLSIHSGVNCSPFSAGSGSKPINDGPRDYGVLPAWGVLAKSSNPGAARIAMKAKWNRYKEYMEKFGLYRKPVDIELGDPKATLVTDGTNNVNFSRIAYGYSVSVSPLHMAMVYATIANDGVRMKPRLVDRIIADDGSVYRECPPKVDNRVMSSKTAADLRFALETVTRGAKENGQTVRTGTATRAAIPGFRIGGKTGTAKKTKENGGYYDNLYTVSFAGVLPIDDPKVVIMTVIDEPHPTDCNPGGGTVAAPIFRAAAERIIQILNLQPSDPEAYEKYMAEKAGNTTETP